MNHKSVVCVLLAVTLLATGCSPSTPAVVPEVYEPAPWPTEGWQVSTPEEQGMDSALLAQMLEELSANETRIHSVLVIRNGTLVTEAYFHPYTREMKIHLQSVTKSVIGALVGIAIRQGHIKSVDEQMLSFFPHRMYHNPGPNKEAIRLRHLLSMSSGFPCQEFTDTGESMEATASWIQFMLDLPVDTPPGKAFSYCDGNPHLLSVIIEDTTGMNTREFANQELFAPLGIPAVAETDWWTDPQGSSNGGYGLFLRPVDMAKFAYLYLRNGEWDGQQILPAQWVSDSTRQYVQKPEGPGYGYFWTVYPNSDRYSALGVGGQQIHVYPSRDLIVIVTAELDTFMEAPEIERMLNDFILPSIQSDSPLAGNKDGSARLQEAIEAAAHPVQPVPALPAIAREISGTVYQLEENPNEWENIVLTFPPGSSTALLSTHGGEDPEEVGLDNMYRLGDSEPNHLMRGRWVDDQTFVIEWAPLTNNSGTYEIELTYSGDTIEVNIQNLGGPPFFTVKGTK